MTSKEPVPVVEMRDICVEFPPGSKRLMPWTSGYCPARCTPDGRERRRQVHPDQGVDRGVYPVDSGQIIVDGTPRSFTGPRQSQEAGISTVYQEVNLCPNLSVGENILLGREPRRWGGHIDYRALHRRAGELLAQLELDIDSRSRLGAHPIAVQQLVAITRATAMRSAVLILDEPTSSLDAGEVSELFGVIRRLRDAGTAILFVSHFLDQVYAISDRITVLRNGKLVGEYLTTELPPSRPGHRHAGPRGRRSRRGRRYYGGNRGDRHAGGVTAGFGPGARGGTGHPRYPPRRDHRAGGGCWDRAAPNWPG